METLAINRTLGGGDSKLAPAARRPVTVLPAEGVST